MSNIRSIFTNCRKARYRRYIFISESILVIVCKIVIFNLG
nr:MAG TPA: hypothetical protein [Bacteriophage sp.]